MVSRLNHILADKKFILLGPGRWGSSNVDLGVKVTYADIFNTAILGEIAIQRNNKTPEVSYGTHFFQDLVEANIYPLPIYPQAEGSVFNWQFFNGAPNVLAELSPRDVDMVQYVKVINVPQITGEKMLDVVMDGWNDRAIGYLRHPTDTDTEDEYEDETAYRFG